MVKAVGRGATKNATSKRFNLPEREVDGDWLDAQSMVDGEPPKLRTTVTTLKLKTIITRNTSPDVPFTQSINGYGGCEHGCIYCFARPTHAYHGLSPGLDFESRLFAKPDAAKLLRAEFAKPGYRPVPLAMGTNTDPYQPVEREWRITRAVLELCVEVRHPVSVTTKSDRILDDLNLLATLAEQGLAMAMLSVTTLDSELARTMEPRAAAPHRRLAAIRGLASAGIPVAVSVSPVIPGLNDHELEAILAAAAEAGATRAAAMPVRLPHEVAPLFEAWLETHYPDRRQRVLNGIRAMRDGRLNDPDFASRLKGQGEWARLLRVRLEAAKRKLGLMSRDWSLRCDLFERPAADPRQASLF